MLQYLIRLRSICERPTAGLDLLPSLTGVVLQAAGSLQPLSLSSLCSSPYFSASFQLLLQRFLRKAHSLGRWSFHLMLPPRRLIYTEEHTCPCIDRLLSAWKWWRVGRGSFLLANTAAWRSKPCSCDHLFLPPADSLTAPACQKFCLLQPS